MDVPMLGKKSKHRMIRVLHVGPDISAKGGIAAVIEGYSKSQKSFEAEGICLDFLSTCGNGGMSSLWRFVKSWWWLAVTSTLGRHDIVHIHSSIRGSLLRKSIFALTCIALRQNYILHLHSGAIARYVDEMPAAPRNLVRFVCKHAAHVICLSRDTQTWLRCRLKLDADSSTIVYNGIQDQSAATTKKRESSEIPTILFLGKLLEAKGVSTLLEAAENLKFKGVPYRLLIGGNGEAHFFMAESKRRGLSDRVSFLGWVAGDEKLRLLSEADIFVLPSRSEGFPVSIVEAMSFGIPIVSTRIPGVTDAITHDHEGLLVPPDDVVALTGAIASLIDGDELRGRLSQAARQRFLDQFTVLRSATDLARIYRKVLN
jgi:glycosyltransferase involved in cell wall biosynthesis